MAAGSGISSVGAVFLRFAGDPVDTSPDDRFLETLFAALKTCLETFSSPNTA